MAITSARISGEVSLRNTSLRALSAFTDLPTVGSGVQVRDQLALEASDLVLQHELAFLEALQLQLVGMDVERQSGDDIVQVAMLNAQLAQLLHVAEQLAI